MPKYCFTLKRITLSVHIALAVVFLWKIDLAAQIPQGPSLSVMRGQIDFNSRILYNPNNSNTLSSYYNQITWLQPIHSRFNFYFELGLGHYNNMSTDFEPNQHSGFNTYGLGVQFYKSALLAPNSLRQYVQAFADVGYTFEYIHNNRLAYRTKSCPTLHLGGGLWFKTTTHSAVGYTYRVNQRLQQDYRTYNTHQVGFLLSLHSFLAQIREKKRQKNSKEAVE